MYYKLSINNLPAKIYSWCNIWVDCVASLKQEHKYELTCENYAPLKTSQLIYSEALISQLKGNLLDQLLHLHFSWHQNLPQHHHLLWMEVQEAPSLA